MDVIRSGARQDHEHGPRSHWGVAFGLALGLVANAVGQGQFDMVRLPVTGSFATESGTFAFGDLDRDGDPDLVWVVADGLTVVLLNEGELRFVPTTNRLPGHLHRYTPWLLGDVDGDAAPDILIEDPQGLAIWRNDRRGFFSIDRSTLPARTDVQSFALADFDNDGLVDIAAAFQNWPFYGVEIWRNASARFVPGAFAPMGMTTKVRAHDLNMDGRVDLLGSVVGYSPPSGYSVWINSGSSGFAHRGTTSFGNVYTYDLGDIDGDGDLDLLDPAWVDPRIWLNDGAGRLIHSLGALPSQTALTVGSTVADFDGDVDVDIFFGNGSVLPHRDQLFLNDGRGRFTDVTGSRFVAPPTPTGFVDAADLDGDGDIDIVAAEVGGGVAYRNMLRHSGFASRVRIGQPATLTFAAQRSFASPGQFVFPALSTLPLAPPVEMAPFGVWRLALTGLVMLPPLSVPSPSGVATLTVSVPAQAGLVGQTASLQALVAHTAAPSSWRFTGVARAAIER